MNDKMANDKMANDERKDGAVIVAGVEITPDMVDRSAQTDAAEWWPIFCDADDGMYAIADALNAFADEHDHQSDDPKMRAFFDALATWNDMFYEEEEEDFGPLADAWGKVVAAGYALPEGTLPQKFANADKALHLLNASAGLGVAEYVAATVSGDLNHDEYAQYLQDGDLKKMAEVVGII